MTDLVKNNEYHKNYYNTKVDKTKRRAQFKAYYLANKQEISDKRKAIRLQKKAALVSNVSVVKT